VASPLDERNAMVCSPSSREERWRRKNLPELERSHRSRRRRRSRVTDPITVYSSTRGTPRWCPFASELHGFAGKARRKVGRNLVDAKVRRQFVGARVIQTERGWRRWEEDADEIIGSYLLAEIESDFIFFNFGLKIISGNPEIIIKSRKLLRKLRS
jgi:hypothetical protein